jgi:hypothetical protein
MGAARARSPLNLCAHAKVVCVVLVQVAQRVICT